MNDLYSEMLGTADDNGGVDFDPYEDVPPFTGNEWWRDGAPRPPGNMEYDANGVPYPNAPYGSAFSADAPYAYNPAKRAPYGATYAGEFDGVMEGAIDVDPYAIGQNLGLMGTLTNWDSSSDALW